MKKEIQTENGSVMLVTDNKWKHFKYRDEVPKKVWDFHFDHLSEEDDFDGFLCYRKRWYHISDFMRTPQNAPEFMREWHGYLSDSFFSGVLIQCSDGMESYKIATYIS